jgi:hypothetical protein
MSTLSFDVFWSWLMRHANCILRAGSPGAVLYDDEDLHWHFAAAGSVFYVQVIRGKRLLGEFVVDSEQVAYIQSLGEEPDGEHLFELIAETGTDRVAGYFFVLSHGFEEEEVPPHERAVH